MTGEDMSMVVVMKAGQAARFKANGLHRFHALDMIGLPKCAPADRLPIYQLDYEHMLGVAWVPEDHRCHRWGCNEAWVELTHDDGQ